MVAPGLTPKPDMSSEVDLVYNAIRAEPDKKTLFQSLGPEEREVVLKIIDSKAYIGLIESNNVTYADMPTIDSIKDKINNKPGFWSILGSRIHNFMKGRGIMTQSDTLVNKMKVAEKAQEVKAKRSETKAPHRDLHADSLYHQYKNWQPDPDLQAKRKAMLKERDLY